MTRKRFRWLRFKHRLRKKARNPLVHVPFALLAAAALVSVVLVAVIAWRNAEDVRPQQARIALANDRPELALRLANEVLEDSRLHADALQVKAESELRLARLDDSRMTLDRLIKAHPDLIEARALLARWIFAKLGQTRSQPEFGSNQLLADSFEETMALGLSQADWLAGQDDPKWRTEARFIRACLCEASALALGAKLQSTVAAQQHTGRAGEAADGPSTRLLSRRIAARIREAEQHLVAVVQAEPHHYAAWASYIRLLADRDDAEALLAAERLLTDMEHLPAPLAERAVAALIDLPETAITLPQRIQSCGRLLKAVRPEQQHTVFWLLGAARLHLADGQPDQATAMLQDLLQLAPQHYSGRYLLARSLYDQQRYADAVMIFRQLTTESPPSSALSLPYGLALLKSGDIVSAERELSRAVAGGEADPEVRRLLARLCLNSGKPDQAETHLLALVRDQPQDPANYLMLATFYAGQQRIGPGLLALEGLEETHAPWSCLAQASLLRRVGRPAEALQRLEAIYGSLVAERDDAALRIAHEMAAIHLRSGDRATARGVYDPMIAANLLATEAALSQVELTPPDDDPGHTLVTLDELADRLTPHTRRNRYQVMRNYVRVGRYDRALALLDEWLESEPRNLALLCARGELLIEAGDAAQAAGTFERVLDYAGDDLPALWRLARARLAALDYPAAEEVLRRIAEVGDGADAVALVRLGLMYSRLGLRQQADEACDSLARVTQPDDPALLLDIGRLFSTRGRAGQARRILDSVTAATPQYGAAQALLARLDLHDGSASAASWRMAAVAADQRSNAAAARELLAAQTQDRQTLELLCSLDGDLLPDELRTGWLRAHVVLAAQDGDWEATLASLDRLSELVPEAIGIDAARVALLAWLEKTEEARQLYSAAPALARSNIGPLVALILDESYVGGAPRSGLVTFLGALAGGDSNAALAAIDSIGPSLTVFRSDLRDMLDDAVAHPEEQSGISRRLALALLAYQADLPHLCAAAADEIARNSPRATLPHSLYVQSTIDLATRLNTTSRGFTRHWRDLGERLPEGSSLALLVTAQMQASEQSPGEALVTLQSLLRREPGNPHLQHFRARLLAEIGSVDGAITLLRRLHMRSDSASQAVTNTSLSVHDSSGHLPPALWVTVSNHLAYLLAQQGRDGIEEAHAVAAAALAVAPGDARLLDTLGWIELQRGHTTQALQHLKRAVAGAAGVAEVHHHLGEAYLASGNAAWARYHLDRAADSAGTAALLDEAPDPPGASPAVAVVRPGE